MANNQQSSIQGAKDSFKVGTELEVLGSGTSEIKGSLRVKEILTADKPIKGDLTGNAATTSKWKNERGITLDGDMSGQVSIDGSKDVTLIATLDDTGVIAGTYGSGTSIPTVMVDSKGRVLGVSTTTISVGTLGAISNSKLGQPNGVALLNASGKLYTSQIPSVLVGAVVYRGVWNAATNTPTLVSGTGSKGDYYKISVKGMTEIDGHAEWEVGDTIIYNGTTWDSIDGSASEVLSVSGRGGHVVLAVEDIGGLQKVAKTNQYGDLAGLPYIPMKVSDLANDTGFITSAGVPVTSVFGRIGNVSLTATDINTALGFTASSAYVLQPATVSMLGGVKIGTGLTVLADGTIKANVNSVAGRTGDVVLTKSDVGLSNVDNTSDSAKPVSTAQAAANTAVQNAAATDATTKANTAQANAISTAATDATTKASGAQSAAALDATTKASAAQAAAISAAATDATTKANAAQAAAIAASAPVAHVGAGGTAHAAVTTAANGFMTAADKVKLDGMAAGATVAPVTSVASRTGAVVLSKSDVGLSNVDNTTDAAKPVSTATQTALNAKISSSLLGMANGVATLDAGGQVPATQLPSYVDDVLEYANLAGFPAIGEAGKIYVALDTNKTYRWSGSTYIYITSGAVDSVAGELASYVTAPGAASSYGSASIAGTKNTYAGFNFRSTDGVSNLGTLRTNGGTHGWYNSQDNNWSWNCDNAGNFTATGNVAAYSDESLKKNWREFNSRDIIEQLATVKSGIFDRIDIDATQIGVSANSLEFVLPAAVGSDAKGIKHVAYGNAALAMCVELAREVVALRGQLQLTDKKHEHDMAYVLEQIDLLSRKG